MNAQGGYENINAAAAVADSQRRIPRTKGGETLLGPRVDTDGAVEDLYSPIVLRGSRSAPLADSRSSGWYGVGLEIYANWQGSVVAEYPYTSITLQLLGKRRVYQRRGRQESLQTTYAGCVIVTPAGGAKEWRSYGETGCRFAVVNLSRSLQERVLSTAMQGRLDIGLRDDFGSKDTRMEALIRALVNEYECPDMASGLYVEAIATQMIIHLARHYAPNGTRIEVRISKLSRPKLQTVVEFIEENLSRDLTVPAIARVAAISGTHFATMFKSTTGKTIHQYVLERRMARAQTLLRSTGLTIAQIAYEVGFSTPSHFCVAFCRSNQVTPRRYRLKQP